MSNHDQPHLCTHISNIYKGSEKRRFSVVAYLCVYEMNRCYGGPEEGGWWYDDYEFTGACFPFKAEQEYELVVVTQEDFHNVSDENVFYNEEEKEYFTWRSIGLPYVTDEPTRVKVFSAWTHFKSIYGDPDAPEKRGSVMYSGGDVKFIYELTPGERGNRPRPRYE